MIILNDPLSYMQRRRLPVKIKAGGIGPFAGGYGFGARSTLLGYFLRLDAAWEMNGVFKGKPIGILQWDWISSLRTLNDIIKPRP